MRDPGLRDVYKTEIQVGLLMLVAFVGLLAGVAWISGLDFGGERLRVFATSPHAGSVTDGARVTLLGVDVGEVTAVEIDGRQVVLALEVSFRGELPIDSRAEIRSAGFLGAQVVALIPGDATASVVDGDTLRGGTEASLTAMAGEIGGELTDVLNRVEALLSDEMIGNLEQSSGALAGTLTELQTLLERQRATIETILQGLSETSSQLAEATSGPELGNTISNVDSLTARLSRASDDLDSSSASLASILQKIDEGDGSIGRMLNDPELYDRLTATTENVQAATEEIALLTKEFREQPDKYLKQLKITVF